MSKVAAAKESRQARLRRRVKWIVLATISYNFVEAVIALLAGAASSSIALIGFGLDSTIEVLSAVAVLWQFTRREPEKYERATLRVIAIAFFLLAAYVLANSTLSLLGAVRPEHSTVGIILTAVSVIVMPFLSLVERRTGLELGSPSVVADSKQTLICSYLSASVLIGLVLNGWLEWWWADPIAALVIVWFAVREGIEAWRGDACATSVGMLLEDEDDEEHAAEA